MESFQGQLLLASSNLRDPNFARTVILIVQHDENGAVGLILNRPLELTVEQVCNQSLNLPCAVEGVLHQGGPCEEAMMILHNRDAVGDEIVGSVFLTADRAEIEALLLNPDAKIKCFVGYAGWTAGQLEAEFESGSWLTLPADPESVFDEDAGANQWTKLITRATLGRWIDPSQIPDDPSVN